MKNVHTTDKHFANYAMKPISMLSEGKRLFVGLNIIKLEIGLRCNTNRK